MSEDHDFDLTGGVDRLNGEIQRSLGRIEGKLDALYSQYNQCLVSCKVAVERITALENYRAQVVGWTTAIAAVVAIAANFIFRYFS